MNQNHLEAYIVLRSATIEAALAIIEANHHRCAIVVDESKRVVGTLSDGDVRRALLNHRLLTAPVDSVMNLNFVALSPGEDAKAREIAERLHIHVFPVVGPGNELLDVVTAY
jgi:CBS domain-containing protein